MASSGDGDGSGPQYLDPDHVYKLYIKRRPKDLVDYVDSFPGADDDARCFAIKQIVRAFLPYVTTLPGKEHTELSKHQKWADRARTLAQECSLAAPQHVVDETNITSNPVLRHAATLNQGSDSSLTILPATSTPLLANSNDALAVGVLPLHQPQPGSDQVTPQEMVQNTVSPQEQEQSNLGTSAVGVISQGDAEC